MTVDFARDIKPILERLLHPVPQPGKAEKQFRLDNRLDALKGGDNGVDIIPGHSAKSPLIHYVAQLVNDLEMPPPGKGDPLTPAANRLLRAWIDQGAAWDAGRPADQVHLLPFSRHRRHGGQRRRPKVSRTLLAERRIQRRPGAIRPGPTHPPPQTGFPCPATSCRTITNSISPSARMNSASSTPAGINIGSTSMVPAAIILN